MYQELLIVTKDNPEARAKVLQMRPPDLTAAQIIAYLTPEERLAGLGPEQRLAGLEPEQIVETLTPEERKKLLEILSRPNNQADD